MDGRISELFVHCFDQHLLRASYGQTPHSLSCAVGEWREKPTCPGRPPCDRQTLGNLWPYKIEECKLFPGILVEAKTNSTKVEWGRRWPLSWGNARARKEGGILQIGKGMKKWRHMGRSGILRRVVWLVWRTQGERKGMWKEKQMGPDCEGPRNLNFILCKEQSLKTELLEQRTEAEKGLLALCSTPQLAKQNLIYKFRLKM